jgi:hypothetical protein
MKEVYTMTSAVISLLILFGGDILGDEQRFEYPCHLVDIYNPDQDCWKGMDVDGRWPVPVEPALLLVGPPPSKVSGVTLPTDHWVELQFRGTIVDGPGDDIFLIEQGQCGEQALIFLTDGAEQEYLLGMVRSLDTGLDISTRIALDIAGLSLPFPPSAVRIVAVDNEGGSPGFDIANVMARIYIARGDAAGSPVPPDGAADVPTGAVLSWSPGRHAAKHTVYFGTSPDDVGANAVPVSSPSQPQDANRFDPGRLQLGKTYYWRVNEVNDSNPNSPWMGSIWSFTVVDHIVIDNFESYNRQNKPMYETWRQIGEAFVDISIDPVCTCRQAMKFDYYYEPDFYSEAIRTFSPPQNWASAGVKFLELFFYGRPGNEANGQMYVAFGDGNVTVSVPYDGDVNNIKKQTWQSWRIPLQELTGLNLANVETIAIGFRPGMSEPPGSGVGTVYFDDITLHPARCLSENRPHADLSGDCTVNFEDLEEVTASWLESGYNVYPVVAPKPPLVWYKFDGDARDSAGSSHGIPHGSPAYAPGVFGQAINFDGFDDSVSIDGALELFSKINKKITIAFWQYGKDSPHHTDTVCCSNYTYGVGFPPGGVPRNPTIAINLGCWRQPGKYNWDCGYPWSFDNRLSGFHRSKAEWTGRWNHWAFTKDANTDTMKIFLNGVLYDSRIGAGSPITGINSYEIGTGWYGRYDGLIDDFRVYDYALSQPEVAYIATNGTGIFDLALLSPADLYPDDRIDFHDFAVLVSEWLDNQLWP